MPSLVIDVHAGDDCVAEFSGLGSVRLVFA